MTEFRAWLLEEDLASEEETAGLAEGENAAIAERYLHAEIFNSAFGIEARYQILAAGDLQVIRALEALDEATSLLARRQELKDGSQRAAAAGV